MIGQMRLAWWHDALTDDSGLKGRGEPVIDALRGLNAAPPAGLAQWLDGWEALIGEIDLPAYAQGRGGGLFRALAGEDAIPHWLAQAGAAWALWDLSGQASDGDIAEKAIAMARRHLLPATIPWPGQWRPMRLAYQLARHDIKRGRHAPPGLTPALYMRLIRLALLRR